MSSSGVGNPSWTLEGRDPLMVLADATGREGPQAAPAAHPEITPDPLPLSQGRQKSEPWEGQ